MIHYIDKKTTQHKQYLKIVAPFFGDQGYLISV